MGKDGDATPFRLRATVKVSNKPPPGVQRGGPEPEAHFLLRLPERVADEVREALASKSLDDVDFVFNENGRHATFSFRGKQMRARLVDLPCIIESHKTFDSKQLYKIADISQMLLVEDVPPFPPQPPGSVPHKLREDEIKWPHGIAPPLYNVRTRRFRKRAKRIVEDVEREVQRLLAVDASADQTRVTFIHDEDDELEDVQVDDDMSDRMSVTSQRSRIAEDLEDDLSDADSVSSRMRAGSELGKEEVDDFAEEEDEEGMGRVREADEDEEEEEEEGEEEAVAEEEEDDEGSDSDAENETVQQRLHRLAAERQAVVVQQMEVAQSLEEKRRQLSAAPPNPIIRGRIQTAVTELEAQHASLQEQIAAIDERISAMKHA